MANLFRCLILFALSFSAHAIQVVKVTGVDDGLSQTARGAAYETVIGPQVINQIFYVPDGVLVADWLSNNIPVVTPSPTTITEGIATYNWSVSQNWPTGTTTARHRTTWIRTSNGSTNYVFHVFNYSILGTCSEGQTWDAATSSCVTPPPTCPSANSSAGTKTTLVTYLTSPDQATAYDASGCEVVIQCSTVVSFDGQTTCVGSATYTGNQGSPGQIGGVSTPQEIETVERFKQGQCPGEVNGVEVWVPCSAVTVPIASSSSTAPDGSTTTTTSKTTCSGDQCTTDTVTETKDAQGNVTGSSTSATTIGQATFCSSNPDHPLCKSSTFGGSCSAGFTCNGDAIQCEIAKVAWSQKCAFEPTPGAGAAFDDATANPFSIGELTETLSIGSIDQSSAMGSGQCIQDKQIEVWGTSINLPFSMICQYLAYMGTILQAVSLLIAARIVTRG